MTIKANNELELHNTFSQNEDSITYHLYHLNSSNYYVEREKHLVPLAYLFKNS